MVLAVRLPIDTFIVAPAAAAEVVSLLTIVPPEVPCLKFQVKEALASSLFFISKETEVLVTELAVTVGLTTTGRVVLLTCVASKDCTSLPAVALTPTNQ